MQDKEKMFLDLNSVLVKFWIENKRPDKAVKIELLERMLNWYKKMGYVTLDKQAEKKLPDGLEEAAWDCVLDSVDVNNPVLLPKYKELLTYLFIAGAEWQRKQDQSLIELAEDHAMLAGMNKMEEQILEDAIEIEVKEDAGGFPIVPLDAIELYDYENDKPLAKAGDKVHVIIIKDDK